MNLPKDPYILLSFINTKLRDHYPNLAKLCEDLDIREPELLKALAAIDYSYHPDTNQFI